MDSEARLRTMIEYAPDGILVIDLDQDRIVEANFNMTIMLGYKLTELLEKNLRQISAALQPGGYPVDSRIKELQGKTLSGADCYTEWRLLCKDGKELYTEMRLTRYPPFERNLVRASLIDITEKKDLEAESLKTHKLESFQSIAGGIAHDFNNLLSVIMGNVDLAIEFIRPGNKAHSNLQEALVACERARDLTNQFLTISKGGIANKQSGDISRSIRNAANLSLAGSNIKCEFKIADDLRQLAFDRHQIELVLDNIITNARESMPDGGTITITAANMSYPSSDRTPVAGMPPGNYAMIAVTDSGIGIENENISRIFDPYFSTKPMGVRKGLGLGLTIAHSVITKHDGFIQVNSRKNHGTTVIIFLPITETPARTRPVTARPTGLKPTRALKILILEDEDILRTTINSILTHFGHNVSLAAEGNTAVTLFKQAQAAGTPFDMVLLDLTVRGGPGGRETMEKLKKLDPKVYAVVCSGYTDAPEMLNYVEYGFSEAMPKPYDLKKIKSVLNTFSEQHPAVVTPD